MRFISTIRNQYWNFSFFENTKNAKAQFNPRIRSRIIKYTTFYYRQRDRQKPQNQYMKKHFIAIYVLFYIELILFALWIVLSILRIKKDPNFIHCRICKSPLDSAINTNPSCIDRNPKLYRKLLRYICTLLNSLHIWINVQMCLYNIRAYTCMHVGVPIERVTMTRSLNTIGLEDHWEELVMGSG